MVVGGTPVESSHDIKKGERTDFVIVEKKQTMGERRKMEFGAGRKTMSLVHSSKQGGDTLNWKIHHPYPTKTGAVAWGIT